MPPEPDGPRGFERMDSNGNHGEEKKPFMYRVKTGLTNFMKSFRIFLYNKEHQTIFGNTSSSWIKISIYYFFFYLCLGLFFSGMIAVFAAIVSRESPTYTYRHNQMKVGGKFCIGMGFRPMPDITSTSLTVYGDSQSQNTTVSSLTSFRYNFLTQYDTTYLEECSPFNPASKLRGSHSCKFSWDDIVTSDAHPCSTEKMYGWPIGQPCILIKLNQIYGWMPADGNIIDAVANATGQPILPIDQQGQNIYITCEGREQEDKNKTGSMIYYSILHPLGIPNYGGIPYYFFPYRNAREEVEPFVLVQFTSLPFDTKVNIICRAWAPDIQQYVQGSARRGVVTFDILRSNKSAPVTK
ncbi:unnamed protein product [Rotaria sordida]|uniref:Uncharacterized protein n=1 Tax=Rotaria sordida TaxID=392033 RepID=A0A813TYK2_9BILA|nr:unnamed protein product [Rotaria sordida]CAF4002604.1 unnamed protein product [Rotaria sordida]